jgi:DNA-directed RNA polymerase specialized sigma24 family protein
LVGGPAERRALQPASARQRCHNHWRTRARHPEEPVGASLPTLDPVISDGSGVDERLTLDGLLAELSPTQRAVLVLRL